MSAVREREVFNSSSSNIYTVSETISTRGLFIESAYGTSIYLKKIFVVGQRVQEHTKQRKRIQEGKRENPEFLYYTEQGERVFRRYNMCVHACVSRSLIHTIIIIIIICLSPPSPSVALSSLCVRYKHEQLDLPRNYARRFSCHRVTRRQRRL